MEKIEKIVVNTGGSVRSVTARKLYKNIVKQLGDKADRMSKVASMIDHFGVSNTGNIRGGIEIFFNKNEIKVSPYSKEKCYELPGDPSVLIYTSNNSNKQ